MLVLTACSGSTSPLGAVTPSPSCAVRLGVAPLATETPVAIFRDVAGGPVEYLAGVPAGRVVKLPSATGFSPPQFGGGDLFFSVRRGLASAIYRGAFGGCAIHVADGTLGAVERQGRALTALVGDHWVMLDRDGKRVVVLTGAAGAWTQDGRLVEPAVGGIDVYTMSGKKHSIPTTGISPLSPLGDHLELVATASGVQSLDLDTGKLAVLNLGGEKVLRAPAGSPDGTHVAFLDANGIGRVLDLTAGTSKPLAASSLPTGFAWSHDSQWVAVQAVYGGVELNVASGRLVDSGSLVVVSW